MNNPGGKPDEPNQADLIAALGKSTDRACPNPSSGGIADAAKNLYTEQTAVQFDLPGRGPRFADVLAATHLRPDSPQQADPYRYLLDRRPSITGPTLTPPAPSQIRPSARFSRTRH